MTAFAILLAATIIGWRIDEAAKLFASGMEARQGGDVKQAPSRSDDSPPGRPNPITPQSREADR